MSPLDIVLLIAFIGGTTGLSLVVYFLARLAARSSEHDRHRDVATSMVVRIGALQGLILALVFAQEMGAYQRLEAVISTEASAVADVFNDAERYGDDKAALIQQSLVEYLEVVTGEEWQRLGRTGDLSPIAWEKWDQAYRIVLELEPRTAGQTALHDHMISQMHAVGTARDQRARDGGSTILPFFWLAALSGVVLISGGYYVYPAERQNIVLMGLFNAYTGIILYMIYAFSNPFLPPAALQPEPLARLLRALTT